jgi:hypothetical protein
VRCTVRLFVQLEKRDHTEGKQRKDARRDTPVLVATDNDDDDDTDQMTALSITAVAMYKQ